MADYTGFHEGPPNPLLFATPKLCKEGQEGRVVPAGRHRASQLRWAGMVPAVRYQGDAQVGG